MPRLPMQNYSGNDKDRCQTPPYALLPLLPYLPKDKRIWECASGGGLLARALRENGYRVFETELERGHDFFSTDIRGEYRIVTNPPYRLKYKWLKRCYEIGKPFALLIPSATLWAARAQSLFVEYGVEILALKRRVNYKMPNKGWSGKGAQFATAWFTWGLNIGQMLTFVDNEVWSAERVEAWERAGKSAA